MTNNKERLPLANTLRADLKIQLKELSEETGINMNKLLDRAIEWLLQDMKNKQI